MGTSDLPLDIQQRIESRWSAQIKRQQQQRDIDAEASPSHSDGADDPGSVDIANWARQRESDS